MPIPEALRAQLAVLRDFTGALSLGCAGLALPEPGSEHLLDFQMVTPLGEVTPFHPEQRLESTALRGLPGNWGRKVVRSSATGLPGRFLDAGLGHWVRGRHPWSLTSTFPAAAFRAAWLEQQAQLERILGFEVLRIEGLASARPSVMTFAASRSAPVPAPIARALPTEQQPTDIDALLKSCHRGGWYHLAFEQEPPSPDAALQLASWAVLQSGEALGSDFCSRADVICNHIRKRLHVPLFATRPRPRFQRNWMVSGREFTALAYLERVLLPGIQRDLAHLPRRVSGPRGVSPEKIELGRLIAATALRGGVANSQHLDALVLFVASDAPICAIGAARMIELQVRSRRAREPIRRTLVLEPYLAALLALERDALRVWLRAWLRAVKGPQPAENADDRENTPVAAADQKPADQREHETSGSSDGGLPDEHGAVRPTGDEGKAGEPEAWLGPDKRYERWNAAFRAYLRSLHLPAAITLPAFLLAVRQRIQLNATPLLAAYASGELLTHDLAVPEFARLVGCTLSQAENAKWPSATTIAARARRADAQADRRLFADGRPGESLPADVWQSPGNLARRLCGFRTSKADEWLQRIRAVRASCHVPVEQLLCAFAEYAVHTYVTRTGHRDKSNPMPDTPQQDLFRSARQRLSPRFKAWVKIHLTIVWAGLAGLSVTDGSASCLDEATIQGLADETEAYFAARQHRGAWSLFRYFLADRKADHAGFTIGPVRAVQPRFVSAKLLSRAELDRAEARLASVRSGLDSLPTRAAACRHFALVRATGARRAEAAQLRATDVDGNELRIRPYAGHTLKTPAAERVVPLGLLAPDLQQAVLRSRASGAVQLIDANATQTTPGVNFFDAEAQAIKAVADDPDFGPHHLRHTKANALMLSVLDNTVDLASVRDELPWVAELQAPKRELEALLGSDGQCGQGLQAISLLLGHLHPTTTLKHYIHTLGVALYAYQRSLPRIPLQTAFATRVPGRATLYRHASGAHDVAQAAHRLRDFIETVAEARRQAASPGDVLIAHALPRANAAAAEQGTAEQHDDASPADGSAVADWRVEDLEAWQRYFATGDRPTPIHAKELRSGLVAIAQIPSGKRGSSLPRHPLPLIGHDGLCLPAWVHSGVAATHAAQLLGWLARLQRDAPMTYAWLIEKWLYASDAAEGSMRLDGEHDVECVRALCADPGIELEMRMGHVAQTRKHRAAAPGSRLRIRFIAREAEPMATGAAATAVGGGPKRTRHAGRGSGAVRWVLTWLAARHVAGC